MNRARLQLCERRGIEGSADAPPPNGGEGVRQKVRAGLEAAIAAVKLIAPGALQEIGQRHIDRAVMLNASLARERRSADGWRGFRGGSCELYIDGCSADV